MSKWTLIASMTAGLLRRRRFGQILIPIAKNDLLRCRFVEGRPRNSIAPATAAVENELVPGSNGVIGDEVELLPQLVELFFTFFVEDEIAQGRIVAEISHHVVESRAEQASFVDGVDGIKTAALAGVEAGRENGLKRANAAS